MPTRRSPAAEMDGKEPNGEAVATSELSPPATDVEIARKKLRHRWELASVLNFLHVFEPVIESGLKISAEDVEIALIEQNTTLAELHIALLKGILPSSKTLKGQDAWMTAVSKTLSTWWPWVGQGDLPLTGAKGEEIHVYKDLEPTSRLLVLKALCEVRADQYDAISYINDAMKNGSEVSKFRKDKLASDGNGISFWYDGNETIGYRLYKEVNLFENDRVRNVSLPAINCQWETLATNLEEFRKIVTEFSSNGNEVEAAVSNTITTDVIPILEKQLKKKLRALHRQRREQMLLNGFRNAGATRPCRNSKPVDYKFDDYDRSITEAIQYANKRKTNEEQMPEENQSKCRKRMGAISNESYNSDVSLRDSEPTESDGAGSSDTDESSHDKDHVEKDDSDKNVDKDNGKAYFQEKRMVFANRPKGLRFSRRLAGIPDHAVPESLNLGAKNRLRQRPNINTAIESLVVSDSEDENSSGDTS